ncbi:MAG: NnrS family protein, partial [Isosphaeraceae bacterium]
FWLLVGLAMLAAGDLAGAVRSVSPPQAYLGATRHALTVGFMTTLILGVAQRLLPILGHNLLAWPRLVAPIFLLIAAGNALRVVTELATLAWPPAFRIMPFSAVLELSALCLFAANVVRTFWPPLDSLHRTGRVTARTHVANLLAEHPWLEDHLIVWGLRYIGRVRSVPAELTLGSLAAGEGFDPETTVARINVLLGGNTASEKKNETSR